MHTVGISLAVAAVTVLLTGSSFGADAKLIEVKKIWDRAPHNAFTDLIRFKNSWFCTFREGAGHVSPDGKLRIIRSSDGESWESAALISDERGDLRDAKLSVTPGKQLMLLGAVAFPQPNEMKHRSLAWFSDDGSKWSEAVEVADPNVWLWRVTWNADQCFGVGYSTDKRDFVRLYRSSDGKKFKPVVSELLSGKYPNESSIVFREDETALCLLRRDPAPGLLGYARPPYEDWEWKEVGIRIGGPHMIELPDGRLIGAVRLYDGKVRTSLIQVHPASGQAKELISFLSGGDTSYAGMVWHEEMLWVSYYSSHEGKTSIYLARVKL